MDMENVEARGYHHQQFACSARHTRRSNHETSVRSQHEGQRQASSNSRPSEDRRTTPALSLASSRLLFRKALSLASSIRLLLARPAWHPTVCLKERTKYGQCICSAKKPDEASTLTTQLKWRMVRLTAFLKKAQCTGVLDSHTVGGGQWWLSL